MATATAEPVKSVTHRIPAEEDKGARPCAFDPKEHPKEAELEAKAIAAHNEVQKACNTALEQAHVAGKALLDLKPKVGHGQWEGYCRTVLGMSERTAQKYMQVATNWGEIKRAGAETLGQAIASIRKAKPSDPREQPTPAERAVSVAVRMVEEVDDLISRATAIDLSRATKVREKIGAAIAEAREKLDELEKAIAAASK